MLEPPNVAKGSMERYQSGRGGSTKRQSAALQKFAGSWSPIPETSVPKKNMSTKPNFKYRVGVMMTLRVDGEEAV